MSGLSVARTSVPARCAAKLIDICIVALLSVLIPAPVGPVLGLLYALLHDAWNGKSIGKRIFGIATVSASRRRQCSVWESALRNLPLGIAALFSMIPFWGWFIVILLGPMLWVVELYLMLTQNRGRRLGDAIARTKVVPASMLEGPES